MPASMASERARLGLNFAEMAEKLGISRGTYIKYEKFPALAPYHILDSMAGMCGCSIEYLVGKTDERLPREAVPNGR